MNRSESQLRTNPRIVPPDLLLKFGYSPDAGIKFDSAVETLSFYQGGTQRVDIRSFGLGVRNGEGLVVGHTAQLATVGSTPEFQVLGNIVNTDTSALFAGFTDDSAGPKLYFLKSRNTSIGSNTIVQDGDELGGLWFTADDGADYVSRGATIRAFIDGTPGANDTPGRLVFSTTADGAQIETEALRIDSSQNLSMRNESYLWIGPDSSNGGFVDTTLTVGLVLNMEANDDNIIIAKSSDIAHGITNFAQTDTFLAIRKGIPGGGVLMRGFSEGKQGFEIQGFITVEDTTHNTATRGAIEMFSRLKSGSGATPLQAEAAIFVVSNNATARMVIQGHGEMHISQTTLVALDGDDDVQIVRGLQKLSSSSGIIESEYDNPLYNYEYLRSKGLAGDIAPDRDGSWLFPLQKTMHAHAGAIWQNYTRHMSLVERVDVLTSQLAIASSQLAALTA